MVTAKIIGHHIQRQLIPGTPDIEDGRPTPSAVEETLCSSQSLSHGQASEHRRPPYRWEPALGVVDGQPWYNGAAIIDASIAWPVARHNFRQRHGGIAPDHVEVTRQTCQDLVTRLPGTSPHVGYETDNADIG